MSGSSPKGEKKRSIKEFYEEHINSANVPDKVLYGALIVAGLFTLYVWLVSLASLCAGTQLTTWLLPYNVFWYVVAGGILYLIILLVALIVYCLAPGKFSKIRAGRWILYAFIGFFFYVIFFVLTLTFSEYYNLGSDTPTIVNRTDGLTNSLFATIPAIILNDVSINAAFSVVDSNFGLAALSAGSEAFANWMAVLVIILFGTTIVFLATVMMVISPWNSQEEVLSTALLENIPRSTDAKRKLPSYTF